MNVALELEALESRLAELGASPAERGTVELIVRRPGEDLREVLDEAVIDVDVGLLGDDWRSRGSGMTADGSANPDAQVTLMNSNVISVIAGDRERWPLAGDQLYVDLDLGSENLPPGTRLAVGSAVLEVTAAPHTGCSKFHARFGGAAVRLVNGRAGRARRLRGMNTRVVEGGVVRQGDPITKL